MRLMRTSVLALLFCGLASWTYAGDKVYTIDDAYRAALGENEIVKIAEEDVIQAGDRVDQAWTYLYPRIVAQGGYTHFNETLPLEAEHFCFNPTTSIKQRWS